MFAYDFMLVTNMIKQMIAILISKSKIEKNVKEWVFLHFFQKYLKIWKFLWVWNMYFSRLHNYEANNFSNFLFF